MSVDDRFMYRFPWCVFVFEYILRFPIIHLKRSLRHLSSSLILKHNSHNNMKLRHRICDIVSILLVCFENFPIDKSTGESGSIFFILFIEHYLVQLCD